MNNDHFKKVRKSYFKQDGILKILEDQKMNKNNKQIDQDFKLNGVSDQIETVFKAQAPYVETKEPYYGFMGVLLRDKEIDKVQCHICGKWFDFLMNHVRMTHKIESKKYRKQFGLPLNFPLCSKKFSEKCREGLLEMLKTNPNRGRYKTGKNLADLNKIANSLNHTYSYQADYYANRHGACFEQLRSRFLIVTNIVGHEPSRPEIDKYDKSLYSQIHRRYGTINKFRQKIGFQTVKKSGHAFNGHVTDEQIFSILRSYAIKHKKNPPSTQFKTGSPI